MGILLAVVGILIPIIGLGVVVYILVALSKNKGKKKVFTSKNLLYSYLYIISFASLIIGVVALAISLNGWFGQKYSPEFSSKMAQPSTQYMPEDKIDYQDPNFKECYIGEIQEIDGQRVCFDKKQAQKDIVNGLSVAIPMIILFLIHRLSIYYIERKGVSTENFKKVYYFASLILFSIGGLVAIPVATYQLLNYLNFRPDDITRINPPGLAIAFVILVVPVWLVFLFKTIKMRDLEDKEE